ncbi:MAG TPA: sigma-70 family RNA polymerase sigma factor, partial [Gemmataceae bacterium]|nr:sigma-70 family RNA polymerase sigma factor [Gemmataceae bacterium]
MSSGADLTGVIRHLQANDSVPDSELLTRYTRHRDEAAFAAVVERYGGLVLGVARRQLAGNQNADDVFQATFLALARSANRLSEHIPLANWLYTVALRQARKARARESRRATVEQSLPPRPPTGDPLDAITGRDLLRLIDEEVARLPEKYRLPVLMCCVQGLSREDAASRLGVTGGRLKGRLERGRRRLADRLAARGLAPILVLGTVVVPAELQARTVSLTANPWAKSIAPNVAALVHSGGVRGWALAAAVALVPFGLAGWAIGLTPNPREEASPVAALADPPANPLPPAAEVRFGTARYRHGTEITTLAVSADGKRAVACSGQHWLGGIRGYDLTDGRALFTISGEFRHAESIALSPDGRTVAVKQWKKIGLFDAATGEHVRTIDHGPQPNGISTSSPWLTFSPDGKTIAYIGGHGDNAGKEITLVNVETGNVVGKLMTGHMVYGVSFSPDGKRCVGGGHDNDKGGYFARMWDVESRTELRQLRHGDASLRTVAYSPDGKTIAGGGDGGWLRIWDAETGKELHSL